MTAPEPANAASYDGDLEGLSTAPVMIVPGYYLAGGTSPYSTAFTQPVRSVLEVSGRDAPLVQHLQGSSDIGAVVEHLMNSGRPRRTPAPTARRGLRTRLGWFLRAS